jgi:hypothetical protein
MKKPETSWSLWCDYPGCDYQFEAGDYNVFGDGWDAEEIVTDSDGRIGVDGKHFCHRHPTTWASDHEPPDASPLPEPPYLLIHDGDTANPIHDDGKVSLVLAGKQA